jgi:hypothetical protein
MLTAYLEGDAGISTAAGCRDHYWELSEDVPLERSNVRMTEQGDIAMVWWDVEAFDGREVHQRHLNAYLARDGACADVHVSKALFQPQDQAAFDAVIAGLSLR